MEKEKRRSEAEKIISLLDDVSEEAKTMIFSYLSALRDKEMADSARESEVAV